MDAVFINKSLSKKEIEYLKQFSTNSVHIFYVNEFPDELINFQAKQISLEPSEIKGINYKSFQEILKFGDYSINKETIAEYLSFDTFSLFHYHKFRLYFLLRNTLYDTEYLKQITKQNFEKIYYFGNFNVKHFLNFERFKTPDIKKRQRLNFFLFFKLLIAFLLRSFIGFFKNHKIRKHLIIKSYHRYPLFNIQTFQLEKGNILNYLEPYFSDDFTYISDAVTENIKNEFFNLNKKYFTEKNDIFIENFFVKAFFDRKIISYYKKIKSKIFQNLNTLIINDSDRNKIFILEELKKLKRTTNLYIFRYVVLNHFFKKNKTKILTISCTDENSPTNRAVFDAAKNNNIITVGIQHGAIHDLHPAYIYTKKDIQNKITPDYTLVWGEKWKELLVDKGNYLPENIIITGQIRTDIISLLRERPEKNKKKVVVYTTQPQRDKNMKYKNAFDVFTVMKDFPDIKLIVKPHPLEKDYKYYDIIAKKAGLSDYFIERNKDLYHIINSADAVIVSFSTVGVEVIYFNKPLIVLDYLKQDLQSFIKSGVGIEILNQQQLYETINLLNNNELNINKNKYNKFIEQNAYKTDGLASKRTVDFIKKIVK